MASSPALTVQDSRDLAPPEVVPGLGTSIGTLTMVLPSNRVSTLAELQSFEKLHTAEMVRTHATMLACARLGQESAAQHNAQLILATKNHNQALQDQKTAELELETTVAMANLALVRERLQLDRDKQQAEILLARQDRTMTIELEASKLQQETKQPPATDERQLRLDHEQLARLDQEQQQQETVRLTRAIKYKEKKKKKAADDRQELAQLRLAEEKKEASRQLRAAKYQEKKKQKQLNAD